MEGPRTSDITDDGGTPLERVRRWAQRIRAESRPVPEHPWGLGAFLLVLAVYVLSAVAVSVVIPGGAESGSASWVLSGTIAPPVAAVLVALGIARWRGNGARIDFAWRCTKADLLVGAKIGGAGLLFTVVVLAAWTRLFGQDTATSTVGQLVGQANFSVPAAIIMFVYTLLLGPICEEIIFRGMCWGAVARWGPFTAFGLSTAIFAAAHLEPSRTWVLLVIGLPIGLARLVTGTTGASVVAHMLNNALSAVAVLLLTTGLLSP